MNAKYKKSLKIVSLLITAIIIGTVSATTYNYMYLNGSVAIGAAKLVWLEGADAPSPTINGGTAGVTLNVQPGVAQNFTEGIFLKNEDTGVDHDLNITVTTALLSSDFTTADAHIYENSTGSWVYVDTLNLTLDSDQYSGTIVADNYYRFTFEIESNPSASGTKDFVLQVTYV